MVTLMLFFLFETSLAQEFRIVSLHPAITENLFQLGLGASLVGTTEYSDHPEEAKKIPRIGDHTFSAEKIMALRPTHIISISDRFGVAEKLAEKARIQLVKFKFEELADLAPAIESLGRIFGVQQKALEFVQTWKKKWNFKNSLPPLSVFVQIQIDPLVAAGQGTFINELLNICGYKNSISKTGYPALNRESLYLFKIDRVAILLTEPADKAKEDTRRFWRAHLKTPDFFDPTALLRMTLRLPDETNTFCRKLSGGSR